MIRRQSNIRPVRGITADTVRALLGLRHAGSDCAYLPIERTRLVDQAKGSAPAPCIDLADVPATLRDDCDAYPAKPIARPMRGKQGFVIVDEAASFPSVPQPQPPQGCAGEARSALLAPEPTAPTAATCVPHFSIAANQKDVACGADHDEARGARGQNDRAVAAGRDNSRRDKATDRSNRKAGRLSGTARPGTAARSAGVDGQPDSKPTELKQNALAITRLYAGEFDFRPVAPVASRPDPIALRREAIERAIRFLKSRCILVDIVDRTAAIRTYRVTGKRDRMLAEQVIEHAIATGMAEQG